jgi:hypothetical protein
MRYSRERALMESKIAVAHRAVVAAKNAADEMGDDGAYLDLQQIEVELCRVAEGSLRGKGRSLIAGQLSIDTPSPGG